MIGPPKVGPEPQSRGPGPSNDISLRGSVSLYSASGQRYERRKFAKRPLGTRVITVK